MPSSLSPNSDSTSIYAVRPPAVAFCNFVKRAQKRSSQALRPCENLLWNLSLEATHVASQPIRRSGQLRRNDELLSFAFVQIQVGSEGQQLIFAQWCPAPLILFCAYCVVDPRCAFQTGSSGQILDGSAFLFAQLQQQVSELVLWDSEIHSRKCMCSGCLLTIYPPGSHFESQAAFRTPNRHALAPPFPGPFPFRSRRASRRSRIDLVNRLDSGFGRTVAQATALIAPRLSRTAVRGSAASPQAGAR